MRVETIPIKDYMQVNGQTRYVYSITILPGKLIVNCASLTDIAGQAGNIETIIIPN